MKRFCESAAGSCSRPHHKAVRHRPRSLRFPNSCDQVRHMSENFTLENPKAPLAKFQDPERTLDGKARAKVAFDHLQTLWINTGTLCNIECVNCYIESSPKNDRLSYITRQEFVAYLDEIQELQLKTAEIGFTGGEPFMNPECCDMISDALATGFEVLVLTNAMRPMMRPQVHAALVALNNQYPDRLTIRVSLDHYSEKLHDAERGAGSWSDSLDGLRWLSANNFRLNIAGRTCWGEDDHAARKGYGAFFAAEGIRVDENDPAQLVLFPEMDETVDVPEITTDCWGILNVSPKDMMCATSRMVVKPKGASRPEVIACTLLPYEDEFVLGHSLKQAQGSVALNHAHCAKFCVLGGGSCSVADDGA